MKYKMNQWVPVNEHLSNLDGHYLVTIQGKFVKNTLVKYGRFNNGKFDIDNVIAWMNLPFAYNFIMK